MWNGVTHPLEEACTIINYIIYKRNFQFLKDWNQVTFSEYPKEQRTEKGKNARVNSNRLSFSGEFDNKLEFTFFVSQITKLINKNSKLWHKSILSWKRYSFTFQNNETPECSVIGLRTCLALYEVEKTNSVKRKFWIISNRVTTGTWHYKDM